MVELPTIRRVLRGLKIEKKAVRAAGGDSIEDASGRGFFGVDPRFECQPVGKTQLVPGNLTG